MLQRVLKIAAFVLYFIIFIGVAAKLFFPNQFEEAVQALKNRTFSMSQQTLVIGFSEPVISLDPLANDTGSRSRLLAFYEPLVRVTPDLQIEPALAISYGVLNDVTWEFRLRPEVSFHDGTPLTFDDVEASLRAAKENSNSGVRDLASTIKEIKKINDEIFHIITAQLDPLLLQKISYLLIFPRGNEKNIGTGPYRFLSNENGTLVLERFADYWGKKPAFEVVKLRTFTNKDEKIAALKNHSVDIVANVPPDRADNFNFKNFTLKKRPTLESNFLLFHFDKTLREKPLREAVSLALDTARLARLAAGYATPISQFVSEGIFGFNPDISVHAYDPERAKELIKNISPGTPIALTLDLPKGLEVLGKTVVEQLNAAGFSITPRYLSLADLSKKIAAQESEFYFFGWRSDLGDSGDFLTAVAHSKIGDFGQFNGGNYRSPEVDGLIEEAQKTIQPGERLAQLRQAMKIITKDDIIGIPLFSPEVLYGVSTKLKWTPRVDGYVLAQEVKL